MKILMSLSMLLFLLQACSDAGKEKRATPYDFPEPVDTSTKPIETEVKQVFDLGDGVFLSNDFLSARLNAVQRKNDTLLVARITAENYPVNNSPWYAFKAWASESREIYLSIEYNEAQHRYHPKISHDGNQWTRLDGSRLMPGTDSTGITLKLPLTQDTLWVAAQEIYHSKQVRAWSEMLAADPRVYLSSIGKSTLGRDMLFLDINDDSRPVKKDVIVIFSRQHPPEVTGFFAMQAFVNGIIRSKLTGAFLEKYRVLVYPLLNPDGVDLGHWRHNAGGVDLNRDWAYYRQPEVRAVADHVVHMAEDAGGRVIFGLDFHSTYRDVYYTQDKNTQPTPTTPWFREQWFQAMEAAIPGYRVNESPLGLTAPVTKGWFYTQFQAEGVTFEIGDRTPRDSIKLIGRTASEEMMRILLKNRPRY